MRLMAVNRASTRKLQIGPLVPTWLNQVED